MPRGKSKQKSLMKKEYEMAINTVNTGTQVIPVANHGLGERVKDFFLSIDEWIGILIASPKSLDIYDEQAQNHLSVRERAEVDAHFMGL